MKEDVHIAIGRQLYVTAKTTADSGKDTYSRASTVALLAVIAEVFEEWDDIPLDDRMTVESFLIGRWDEKYLRFVGKGGMLNYAAWLRYRSERVELEKVGGEWTIEKDRRLDFLIQCLDLRYF